MTTHDSSESHPSGSKRLLRRSRPVAAIVALLGVIAIAVAGCGGGSASSAAPAAAASPAPSSSAGIPQNNGGDQDADNNGGPSDGDGQI